MYWANFFHFYQPPTQTKKWIDRITEECYRRLIQGFLERPGIKATFNINALLFEFWDKYGHEDVISGVRELLSREQIKLTATAKYHPLLPKLPEHEIIRQVRLNNVTTHRYLGDFYNPEGFFPPEMAYNRKIAEVAGKLGYEWVIAEELSLSHEFNTVDYSTIYEVAGTNIKGRENCNVKIFFRTREISYKILSGQLATPGPLRETLDKNFGEGEYLLTAMDGETFGHHRPGMDQLLFDLLEMSDLEPVFVSDLLDLYSARCEVDTYPSTWALMSHDLEKNQPFARWDDPDNVIHQLQWKLTNLAISAVNNSDYKSGSTKLQIPSSKRKGSNMVDSEEFGACNFEFGISGHDKGELTENQKRWFKARKLLDKALHSDQYWWASAKPWWSLEMIERGAKELLSVVETLPDASSQQVKEAQELYYKIITKGFEWQRAGKVEEMAEKEDEAVRMRTDHGLPDLAPEEIDTMIVPIRKEMLEAAGKQEYERAAQLRDRIEELEGYKNQAQD
ncbi:MAG: UvrB/UvrC motif-containing protein [Patescibacteria group bacterium]|nr:UvrB/UvrC motif-containing protein [Patescibacteria group bacterium]